MNLLNITTHHWRSASFRLPVLRTVFHREKKTRGKTQRDGTHRNSCCAQRVRLEFYHPLARKVEIAGSFNDWRPGATWMVPLGDGRWTKALMLLPGRYEYCCMVPDPKGAIAAPDRRGYTWVASVCTRTATVTRNDFMNAMFAATANKN
jgi:1,4-alpha-glucan branching enzyme